jgi:hypothetical protein
LVETLSIPSGVTTIGNYAFANLMYMTSLYIPLSVTTIGNGVVQYGAEGLIIYVSATEKPSGWNVNWNPDGRTVVWGYLG